MLSTWAPAGGALENTAVKLPLASVVAVTSPRKSSPSPDPEESAVELAYSSMITLELTAPATVPLSVIFAPLFVTLLLTRVSGVPLLEKKADQKWGGQPDYEAYKQRTPVLIPRL